MTRDSTSLDPVVIVDLGTVNGHRVQGLAERATLIVDGVQAILCRPLEYQLALLLLQAGIRQPLSDPDLQTSLGVNKRTLSDLVTQLRKKFEPLGLSVAPIAGFGYMLVSRNG